MTMPWSTPGIITRRAARAVAAFSTITALTRGSFSPPITSLGQGMPSVARPASSWPALDVGFRSFPPLFVALDEEAVPENSDGHGRAQPGHGVKERRPVVLQLPLPFQSAGRVRHAVDQARATTVSERTFAGWSIAYCITMALPNECPTRWGESSPNAAMKDPRSAASDGML